MPDEQRSLESARRVLEATFRPQPRTASTEYAVLPQQSDDELLLSKVHTKLDRVLRFLKDLGYTLLDDGRPRPGGGVQLQLGHGPDGMAALRAKPSTRMPRQVPQVDEAETRQVIMFSRGTAKYAQYPDDLVLVWRFGRVLAMVCPEAAQKVQHEVLYRTVLLAIRLMHLCDYSYSDVVVTLAYASVYFKGTFASIGDKMNAAEAAHVSALLVFLAHCFVLDDACPLRCWQKHIFRKYCTLKVLDAALFRLFELHNFKLRISEEDERYVLSVLLCPSPSWISPLCSSDGLEGASDGQQPSPTTTAGSSGCAGDDCN